MIKYNFDDNTYEVQKYYGKNFLYLGWVLLPAKFEKKVFFDCIDNALGYVWHYNTMVSGNYFRLCFCIENYH